MTNSQAGAVRIPVAKETSFLIDMAAAAEMRKWNDGEMEWREREG